MLTSTQSKTTTMGGSAGGRQQACEPASGLADGPTVYAYEYKACGGVVEGGEGGGGGVSFLISRAEATATVTYRGRPYTLTPSSVVMVTPSDGRVLWRPPNVAGGRLSFLVLFFRSRAFLTAFRADPAGRLDARDAAAIGRAVAEADAEV